MIEELTSFEIKKIFGDDLKPSTYKLLYDMLLDLQKQFSQLGIDNDTFKAQLKATITDKIKTELNNLLATNQLQDIINNSLTTKFNEVIEARKSFPSLGDRLNKFDEKIETIDNKKMRKFKPDLGFSPWFLDNTMETLKSNLKACVNAGIDSIQLALHVALNSSNDLTLREDIETVKTICREYENNNIKIKMLKFHCKDVPTSFKETESFNNKYINFIKSICNQFSEFAIEYLIILNEEENIYRRDDKQDFIFNCIDEGQRLGFKTGITATNFFLMFTAVTDRIKNKCDVLGVNHYQSISNKEEKTSFEDSLNAWKNGLVEFYIKTLKQKYNKEIIITETGVQDNWCALISPGLASWSEIKKSNYKAVTLYMYGMLETLKACDEITGIYIWYSINNSETIKLLSSYTKGLI